jgi:gliding motility-associated-like protein
MRHSLLITINLLSCFLFTRIAAQAQCSDWQARATVTAASGCVASGAFTVSLTGPDVANLSNIRYGIPASAGGFSVPLNSSSAFSGIPPGTYQVSVVAMCGGAYAGRNTSVLMPGAYLAPVLSTGPLRSSLSCGATGALSASIAGGGRAPFTYRLVSAPAAYAGPLSLTSFATNVSFSNLPAGSYTVQATDACQTGTVVQTVVIGSLNESALPLGYDDPVAAGCDSIVLRMPWVDALNSPFTGYGSDPSFTATASIAGISGISPRVSLVGGRAGFRLPPGMSLKDCYGKQITYTIYMPCGQPITRTRTIRAPEIGKDVLQNCSAFQLGLSASGMACNPLQFSVRNTATNQQYGPLTAASGSVTVAALDPGSYSVTMTTADGFTTTESLSVSPVSGNPYSVKVLPGSNGLQGYAAGFEFSTSAPRPSGPRTVALFSGPAGFSYSGFWYDQRPFKVTQNATPTATTLLFPAGTYVWRITDACGSYYLTATIGPADLYRFYIDSVSQRRSCEGLIVTPWLHSTNNGMPLQTTSFVIFLDDGPWYTRNPSGTNVWAIYTSGTPVTLPKPGRYTIVPISGTSYPPTLTGYYAAGGFSIDYPNVYLASQTIVYTDLPLTVDINATQGFLCKGGARGSGQVFAKGTGGIPFQNARGAYYKYMIAAPGDGLSGPYLAANTSGIFSAFGASANAHYDLKIEDSCGAISVQDIRILDLGLDGLISSNRYVGCAGDSVQMSAIYLPDATYSWTGPSGFTSTSRNPVIAPLSTQRAGVYRVTISTSQCNGLLTDTTILTMNPPPPRPGISHTCEPPRTITVLNPVPGLTYKWDVGHLLEGPAGMQFVHYGLLSGTTAYTKLMSYFGSIAAVAIDSATGCTAHSDSLVFTSVAEEPFVPEIVSARLKVCPGDTTTLTASGYDNPLSTFTWLRNGQIIPGAVRSYLVTSQPGTYRVVIDQDICTRDTSAGVTVTITAPPGVDLKASDTAVCAGDTVFLHTPWAPGYEFTWAVNDTTIPSAFDSSLRVTSSGWYSVLVSNGGCITRSRPIYIHVYPAPVLQLTPSADQWICPGKSLVFRAGSEPGTRFTWVKDGAVIPGADSSTLPVWLPGVYSVTVSTPRCPSLGSAPVRVSLSAAGVRLPADTTVCHRDPFLIPLEIDTGFSKITWSTGGSGRGISIQSPGLYWVRAENQCGVFIDSIRVRSLPEYLPDWADDTTVCNPTGTAMLRVPAFLDDIRWSTGESGRSIIARKPGLYWVEGQSPCGPVRDTILIRFCPPSIRSLGITADTVCVGACISPRALADNYPVYFYWSLPGSKPDTGWGIQPGTFCFDTPGVYTIGLRVRNPGGVDSAETQLTVVSKPVPRFRDTALAAPYRSKVILPACAESAHADWYLNDSLICRDCAQLALDASYYHNIYKCVVRNASCPDSCSYVLRVIDIPHEIWLPDAFTPNGDSRNDFFGVITDNPNVVVINLEVYNRWGQRVFVSNLNSGGWDGSFGGRLAEMGTYHWQLRYRVMDKPDVTHYMKGNVLLIR